MLHLSKHCTQCFCHKSINTGIYRSFYSPHNFFKLQTINCRKLIRNGNSYTALSNELSDHIRVSTQRHEWNMSISSRHYVARPTLKRDQPKGSPISWTTVITSIALGTLAILGLKHYKNQKEQTLDREVIQSMGTPLLGGDFNLIDQDGNPCGNKDFLGQWVLIYFGFTHCPDVCPDELEKLGNVIDTINRTDFLPNLQPLFISVDPERDTPQAVKEYLKDFHPNFKGLTGTREQVDEATRAFRVYYASGPVDDDDDYLVDHTVIMYLINDKGEFCEYFGQIKTAGEISNKITAVMSKSKMKNMKSNSSSE